jgi:hypothetical protein
MNRDAIGQIIGAIFSRVAEMHKSKFLGFFPRTNIAIE